jgi:ADP-ribosylglycohydrolase
LFTAEGILRAAVRGKEKGICAPESVVKFAYLRWLKTQGYTPRAPEDFMESGWLIKEEKLFRRRAPGMTCISSLQTGKNRAVNDSKGCGGVMRMAPVGLYFEPESAYKYGCEFSAITHGHPTGYIAGGAFAMIIAYLMKGNSLEKSLDLTESYLARELNADETLAAIRAARSAGTIDELGDGWIAEEALAIGIYCALHYPNDFKAGVVAAVNISGDSDSTGAIAGNILGVMNGEKSIPKSWRNGLVEYDIVSQVADDLYQRFEETHEGHVSENWWNKYPGY